VLQCVAVCTLASAGLGSVVAIVCCGVLQCVLQRNASCCSVYPVERWLECCCRCSVLQCVAVRAVACCIMLQCAPCRALA